MNLTCPDCGQTQDESAHYKDKQNATGRQARCKACTKRRAARYYRDRTGCTKGYKTNGPAPTAQCPACGQQFTQDHNLSTYCSRACANRASGRRRPRRSARRGTQTTIAACTICGAGYVQEHPGTRTCSPACSNQLTSLRNSDKSHHRRTLMHGTTYVPINKQEIYERDTWTCGLCGNPIPQTAHYPDPMSASLDHITPISVGGSHTPDNVQAAHLTCNIRKGNRVGETPRVEILEGLPR